jgi:RecA-family ATPase
MRGSSQPGSVERGPWGEGTVERDIGFPVLSPGIWQGREPPARDWLVEGAFLRGTVALVAGDGGIGKSLLMQQLCSCAALGRPWLGLAVKPGRALHLSCEDDKDELWRRQHAICRHLDTDMADLGDGGLYLAPRVGQDNALAAFSRSEWRLRPTPLFERLTRWCRAAGVQYVVVDTATHTFRGNQNDETQVVDFISELRRLAIAIQGVVVVTKHPSMSGRALGTGESGNVAWNNSVRSRLYVYENKAGEVTLAGVKSNYGRKLEKIPLRWDRGVLVRDEPPSAADYADR